MKNILAIETTGRHASAAVLKYDEKIRAEFSQTSSNDMNHLVDLMSLIDGVIKDAGIRIEDIDIVSPSIGPGSFTGIRIGVTTARALSQSLGTMSMPVRTLRGMAELDNIEGIADSHYVCTTINARRGQTYAALWKHDENGELEELMEQRQYMIDEFLDGMIDILEGNRLQIIFYGDGADSYKTQIEEKLGKNNIHYEIAAKNRRYQDANAIARAAFHQIMEGEKLNGYEQVLPDYMRKTEAEMKLEQGELSNKCKEVGR